jgi:RNA polymerase sigma-70 factor (ECF subfamily)
MAGLGKDDVRRAYELYYWSIVSFFRRSGRGPEASRDLAQDTFLRVYEKREQFRGDSGCKAWVFKIARSILLNEARSEGTSKRRGQTVPWPEHDEPESLGFSNPTVEDSDSPELQAIRAEERRILERGIYLLSPQARQCVRLALAGLTYKEIAGALAITESTVKSHIRSAVEQLRELGPRLVGEEPGSR